MANTDWREILSLSEKELLQTDKEKLSESLSWMEVDDVDLNFSDLKTLFRLSQDIIKYKSEQVYNLRGKIETLQKKRKHKTKDQQSVSPAKTFESLQETIANQEEEIKANKEVLTELYNDIAKLQGRKGILEEKEKESESSPDPLSEMNAVVELENKIAMKNKHLRKLLDDLKITEEENSVFKEKINVLKDKLTEATQIINELTEQIVLYKEESSKIKDIIGKLEQEKSQLSLELETLNKKLFEKESNTENVFEEIKSKMQQWKTKAKSKKAEAEVLLVENRKLREELKNIGKSSDPPQESQTAMPHDSKITELQDKLTEAAKAIDQSANIIMALRAENRQYKRTIEELQDQSISDLKNQSDENKERIVINKLKNKVKDLTFSLQTAEEIITDREKELADLHLQLQKLQSDEGYDALIQDIRCKTRKLKIKDQKITKMVQDVNGLSTGIEELLLQNKILRQKCNMAPDEIISTTLLKNEYQDVIEQNRQFVKKFKELEDQIISLELENRNMRDKIVNSPNSFKNLEYTEKDFVDYEKANLSPKNDLDPTTDMTNDKKSKLEHITVQNNNILNENEIKILIEENEGLRKGLREILDILKDNSTTSSGILALQCPSLEKVLQFMEARRACGWFSPHMDTIMELKSAQGGKDALLEALHEARKETFDVMNQLKHEIKHSSNLQEKLNALELSTQPDDDKELLKIINIDMSELESWISETDSESIDLKDQNQIQIFFSKRYQLHESQLKIGLQYFYNRFKNLFDKIISVTVKSLDDQNKWTLLEENYKAEIENLKEQLAQIEDEEISDKSLGLLPNSSSNILQRKCSYLEESYRYIRTLNENIKNENLECKKDSLLAAAKYESQIQRLILTITNLKEKLCSSIPITLFWKQNMKLNETTFKYRHCLEKQTGQQDLSPDFLKSLEADRRQIFSTFESRLLNTDKITSDEIKKLMDNLNQDFFQKMETIRSELANLKNNINTLEEKNKELQESQIKLIDNALSSVTNQEIELIKNNLEKFIEENKTLKEQCQHLGGQLDIALLQIQDSEQRELNHEMEFNILRHQILDLQSSGENKAIIARLSNEVLVTHLQASESLQKMEKVTVALNKEKERRMEIEDILNTQQKIFEVFVFKCDRKFKYLFEILHILRQQYQGSLPLSSIENYLNTFENLKLKTYAVNEKLSEIEDIRFNLMAKHNTYDQILAFVKNKCTNDEFTCEHKLKCKTMESLHSRELEYIKNKLERMEITKKNLIAECNHLDRSLILLSGAFNKPNSSKNTIAPTKNDDYVLNSKLDDVQSDDKSSSRKSATFTLPKAFISKPEVNNNGSKTIVHRDETGTNSPIEPQQGKLSNQFVEFENAEVQTVTVNKKCNDQCSQTDSDPEISKLQSSLYKIKNEYNKLNKELEEAVFLLEQKVEENVTLVAEKNNLLSKINDIRISNIQKNKTIESLNQTVEDMKNELSQLVKNQSNDKYDSETYKEENKSLLLAIKQLETNRNAIALEYKMLLKNERAEYSENLKGLNFKVMELQSKLDSKESNDNASQTEAFKEVISKYTMKISDLEEKCFRLKNELDECKSELIKFQSETDRWKDLAKERLTKMELLSSQLEERHGYEVESYKAENQHWLTQIHEVQREHIELKSRFTEQKTIYIKQLAEKDSQIEQLRNVILSLKTQVMNLQTMLSTNDPSFDLSAIVEVDEASDALSPQDSDRLELKFDSNTDLYDSQEDFIKLAGSSTTVWQEPVIERLRRDKQLTGKQNAILRRQIKALAARERRARLDAQNLKNQLYRISTTGRKVATAESAALHNKITTLQAQLLDVRRDSKSSVALWDKWKRSQQASERWQARYEDKCQEVKKLESNLNLAKSGITRLEREKRVLLSRLTEIKSESLITLEKQEAESLEKKQKVNQSCTCAEIPVSSQALLERVKSQQRRILALEAAEKGNEHLVSEYEKALAEITSLKGQVLKLESTLLESQIKLPLQANKDIQPEIDYWKSYCEMLKEENVQLTLKINSLETIPATAHQQRINDLEQTILTLRGLVSKLQAEQKTSGSQKRVDSRPSSSRNASDKGPHQLESYRIEISNLKRSIQDKDLLLERSKEMLKIAAEREDELLRENELLRRRVEMLSETNNGFLSA